MSSTVPGILWPWKQLTTTSNFSQLTTKPSTSVILTTTTRTSSPLASTTTSTSTSTSSSSSSSLSSESSSYNAYYDDEDYTDYNDYLFSNLSESSSSISLPVPSSSAFAAASSSEDPVLHSAPSSFLSSLYSGSYNSTAHLDSLNASAAEEYWTRNDSAMTASAAGEDEFAELWNCTTCLFLSYDNGSVGGGSADLSGNLSAFNISDNLNLNLTGESGSGVDKESTVYLIEVLATSIILGFLILATVIGNVFVIAAILLERNLKSVANNLILSLAVADLLVACLVMPFGAVYEVSKEWKMGPELCDMWTSCDVLCCTASILHLVAIALDRYWAVTDIDYAHQRTSKRIGIMIFVIWLLSFLVSIAPLLGWKDPGWDERIEKDLQCIVSQDLGYQIFATASSFYVPLLVILFLYWKIFLTARKRIRRRQQGKCIAQLLPKPFVTGAQQKAASATSMIATAAAASGGIAGIAAVIGRPLPTISEATTTTTTTAFTNASSANTSPVKGGGGGGGDRNGVDIEGDQPTMDNISMAYPSMAPPPPSKPARKKPQQALDSKRERKAAKTLAIITGAFVCCWLPFFILAIILPTCTEQCNISQFMMSVCLWLGYFNSTLNPIIYTIFSPEFRHAFKKILCGRRKKISRERNLRNLRYLVS